MSADKIKICAFGDSVMWGQGLQDKYKFFNLFRQSVSEKYKKPAVVDNLNTPASPHSGATVAEHQGDQVYRAKEIPTSAPTVGNQIKLYRPDQPVVTDVDYVLLNGCANDVSIGKFTHLPWGSDMTKAQIEKATKKFCFEGMKNVLKQTLTRFPNATVVVPGYYRAVSDGTDISTAEHLGLMAKLKIAFSVGTVIDFARDMLHFDLKGVSQSYMDELRENSKNFADAANGDLSRAVAEVKQLPEFKGRQVHFVDPMFGRDNAILAKKPYIWFFDPHTSFRELKSEDVGALGGVREDRYRQVDEEVKCSWYDIMCRLRRYYITKNAAIGHPNVAGARRYAERIAEVLGLPPPPAN